MAKKAQILVEAVDATKTAFDSVERNLKGVNNAVAAVTRNFGAMAGAVGAIEFGRQMIANAQQAEQASNRLTAVLRATGHAAGLTKGELDELADSLAQVTQFDDESFREAEATLLKFGNVTGDVFRQGLKLAADYAAFMGTSVPDAAQTIGKALSSPSEGIGALERQIGKLRPEQEAMIKNFMESGRIMEAQGVVLDVLQGKLGGTAEQMNTGLTRATTGVKKAWDEFTESLGRSPVVSSAAAAGFYLVEKSLGGLKDVVDTFNFEKFKKVFTLDFKADAPAAADPAVVAAARANQLAEEARAFDANFAKQNARVEQLSGDLENKKREAAKRAAEKEQKDREDLLKKGVAWEEAAAIARADAAQELAAQIGQIELRQLHERNAEAERMQQRARDSDEAALRARTEAVSAEQVEQGQIANRARLKRIKGEQDATEEMIRAFEGWGRETSKGFADMVMDADYSFDRIRDSARNLVRDIIAMQINRRITQPIIGAAGGFLDKLIDGGIRAATGGGAGDSAAAEPFNWSAEEGFASGGSFKVGGSGGTDSQLVAFRASPDETVTVETPAQQRGSGGGMTVNQSINVGGNVSHADIPAILKAAKDGALAAFAEAQARGEFA